jgi:purine-binding chemotaxis protein CheW
MKNPSNSDQALEDYFKDLLCDSAAPVASASPIVSASTASPALLKGVETKPLKMPIDEPMPVRPAARLAHLSTRLSSNASFNSSSGFNSSSAINARAPQEKDRQGSRDTASAASSAQLPLRVYADPLKTLNLRMPLPPMAAPAPVEVAVAVVASKPVDEKLPTPPTIDKSIAPPMVAPVEVAAELEDELSLSNAPAAWLDNGRPAWAQQPFECLLFKVGGLALAAPLAELGSIYPLNIESLTGIFGQAAWFMGLLSVKGSSVRTIDAAQVVMPERYAASMREQYRYVITLHGSDWGLAVDSVADSVVLQPDDIRWRGQRSKRPWLAGTVVNQMCALLDVAQLVWMFQNQDGKRAAPRLS